MTIELNTMRLGAVFVQFVPGRRQEAVKFSNQPSGVDQEIKDDLESCIRSSLSRQSLNLTFAGTGGLLSQVAGGLLHTGEISLKDVSRELAKLLMTVQRNATDGYLICAQATCGEAGALVIAKVESKKEIQTETLEIGDEVVNNLKRAITMAIDKKKVFKAAVIMDATGEADVPAFAIIGSDHQASGRDGRLVADYFLQDFLGCTFTISPAMTMKLAVNSLMDYCNKMPDQAAAAHIRTVVTAEIQSRSTTMDLDKIITDDFPTADRAKVRSFLQKRGVTATELIKDTGDLDEMKYLAYTLESGVRIIGPRETLQDMLVQHAESGIPTVRVEGSVLETKLRSNLR